MTQNVLHRKHSVLPLEVKIGEDYVGGKSLFIAKIIWNPEIKGMGKI
jgi:hypothetical protein